MPRGRPKQTTTVKSDLWTVHEVAREFRVDDTTVRRWIKAGALQAVSLPHARSRQIYRIKPETVSAVLNGRAFVPEESYDC